ncbi:hypothetical protein C5H23_11655 [Xylella fastidiosa]|uniref:DUF3693 domain-containing protein n=1 Tax=Xylella fastidiosa TaxID=2371 RepID=UPI00111F3B58|nr:DUF3693 domain-containing protein [Xylella fastidiosa]MDD0930421.1 DUF3693 domain-containing protein [Xylella fastidiosa subsp. multiplex]QTX28445.1 hypothetical protein KBP49_02725 [Xylella fastidiosa subsp. multiplex]TNV88267.1 hypothetical protein C5H23_11655 [Xylella fastidiosa]
MNTINKLLDKAKESCSRKSDAAIAKALKVSGQTIMQWRKDERRITDEHLMAAIKLAKEDPSLAILIRQESAKSEAEKKGWEMLWRRLNTTANETTTAYMNESTELVGRAGIEPATSGLKVRASGKE